MNKSVLFLLFSVILFQACGQSSSSEKSTDSNEDVLSKSTAIALIDSMGSTVDTRFGLPEGYKRIAVGQNSFASYLRNLPLKEVDAKVKYFDGRTKPNKNVYAAVVDLPIGKRDLHQCADAIMRLRAEYLYQEKKYDSIYFNFTNGFKADYSNWRSGKRITVDGNSVYWKQKRAPSDSPEDFWKYLEMVFSYAGTASLSKELKPVPIAEMRIGDVFIKGGFPGHAVIVVDMAINSATNESVFLLAQSYMPAQEIQVLQNPNNSEFSPWYTISTIESELRTPEWIFKSSALKRFY